MIFVRSLFLPITLCLVLVLLSSPITSAQVKPIGPDDCIKLGIKCPGGAQGGAFALGAFIRQIINIALAFVGLIAVIVIIYAGLVYILARGNEKEIDRAKS